MLDAIRSVLRARSLNFGEQCVWGGIVRSNLVFPPSRAVFCCGTGSPTVPACSLAYRVFSANEAASADYRGISYLSRYCMT